MTKVTFQIEKDRESVAKKGVDCFIAAVQKTIDQRGTCRVVVPTGGSPKRFYEILTEQHRSTLDWSQVEWITLDELFGISLFHPATFYSYLRINLFEPLNISGESICAINSEALSPDDECSRFATLCKNADIALLGVGVDGHIGMNFPPCDPNSTVHLLTMPENGLPSTMQVEKDVPVRGITMGMKDILSAQMIILLADGKSKAAAIEMIQSGDVTDRWPVTYLNTHENTLCIVAEDCLDR